MRPLQLLGENEECTRTLCNLILTGRAVKYLHNGNVIYDNYGNLLVSTSQIKPISDQYLVHVFSVNCWLI